MTSNFSETSIEEDVFYDSYDDSYDVYILYQSTKSLYGYQL